MKIDMNNSWYDVTDSELGPFKVQSYLPLEEKMNLIDIVMQQADQAVVVNTLVLEALFHLYIVIKYTDIEFTDEDLADPFKLYDVLETNGIINITLMKMDETEYKTLRENLMSTLSYYNEYRNSARALIEQFKWFTPSEAVAVQEKLKEIDIDKLENVLRLANLTGGNE